MFSQSLRYRMDCFRLSDRFFTSYRDRLELTVCSLSTAWQAMSVNEHNSKKYTYYTVAELILTRIRTTG